MVTKKIRTEYMKKFRDPKWETFSKCYEDSLKYRLTRRVMEHSHKPWFWEGWDNRSDSSGMSTPRLMRNKVSPLSVKPPTHLDINPETLPEFKAAPQPKPPFENREPEVEVRDAPVLDAAGPTGDGLNDPNVSSVKEVPNARGPPSILTDDGPADPDSSDEDPVKPEPRCHYRHRAPRSEPGTTDSSHDDKPRSVRKPSRAKSQPPASTKEKENRRPSSRCEWAEQHPENRRTPNESRTSDMSIQTRRESVKRGSNLEQRRARSADLEKLKSELTVVDDRWMTEYMRCFSARLR
ncbi:centriole, cilia and spindle-associated protein [Lampris incognitus]|uniref:centriole, cilia and spindle-associated protein n=1 Tax=Lampris incognitus TaxID=2546036 RepID=UPI0024B5992C|nr:centriole, cilia and spindle-associated protein [Lampris incognitus]